MKKIAFICGGNSVESEISSLTGLKICSELKKVNQDFLLVYYYENQFYLVKELIPNFFENKKITKGKFIKHKNNYYFKCNHRKYIFDYALILGHGKHIEDGNLKSYFENLNIPCLGEDIYNGVIIQDKYYFKTLLKDLKVSVLNGKVIYKNQINNSNIIKTIINRFDFPLIVKPATLGSSIGINKVLSKEQLPNALFEASLYDAKLLIEPYIEDKIEYNIAIMGYQDDLECSQIEQVNDSKHILSFYDKYDYSKNNNKRVISPEINPLIKTNIINMAKKVFQSLNLCGIIRFDFIYDVINQKLYLNEANLIPGSIAYYLFEKNYSIPKLVEKYSDYLLRKYKDEKLLLKKYQEGFINKIDLSKLKK